MVDSQHFIISIFILFLFPAMEIENITQTPNLNQNKNKIEKKEKKKTTPRIALTNPDFIFKFSGSNPLPNLRELIIYGFDFLSLFLQILLVLIYIFILVSLEPLFQVSSVFHYTIQWLFCVLNMYIEHFLYVCS
jgi:hypothetical protein